MSELMTPVGPGDHILGDADAPVTLLEYGDYECPYCGRAHYVIQEVLRRVGRDVRYVYRHFPLVELHPFALAAAEAAECAGAQGQFWPMHDTLFENQDALETEDLIRYADVLALDTDLFVAELGTHAHLGKVKSDLLSGVQSGVKGTPTFFINEARFDASWDPDTLTAALRTAIREKAGGASKQRVA